MRELMKRMGNVKKLSPQLDTSSDRYKAGGVVKAKAKKGKK